MLAQSARQWYILSTSALQDMSHPPQCSKHVAKDMKLVLSWPSASSGQNTSPHIICKGCLALLARLLIAWHDVAGADETSDRDKSRAVGAGASQHRLAEARAGKAAGEVPATGGCDTDHQQGTGLGLCGCFPPAGCQAGLYRAEAAWEHPTCGPCTGPQPEHAGGCLLICIASSSLPESSHYNYFCAFGTSNARVTREQATCEPCAGTQPEHAGGCLLICTASSLLPASSIAILSTHSVLQSLRCSQPVGLALACSQNMQVVVFSFA